MKHPDVHQFITTILSGMGIKASVEERDGGPHLVYSVTTDDSKILIGHQGETLRALNLVVRRVFERALSPEELKFSIDVNGYSAEREHAIVREARQLAERARLFKYDVDMRPLNPYERMIVHESLRDFGDIVTESRGEGPARHIVLCYRPQGGAGTGAPSPATDSPL